MLRVLKILEMVWLVLSIFAIVMGAYQYYNFGWSTAQWFFGGAIIAAVFFVFRRKQRRKFEQADKNNTKPN